VRISKAAVALALLLCLLAPKASWALQIDILSETVGADTIARVLNPIDPGRVPDEIDDPAANFGTTSSSTANAQLTDTAFTDPNPPFNLLPRVGVAEAVAVSIGVDLQPTSYLFNASAVIGGNGDPYFDESAEATAFGTVVFQISEQGVGAGTEAFIEIEFDEASLSPGIGIPTASFLLTNLTLGTVLFDSSVGGFPMTDHEVTGARVGDQIQIDWFLRVSGDIPDDTARGEVGLEGRVEVIALGEILPVPEPSVALLLILAAPVLAHRVGVRA
jgi:hypothetical protein